MSDRRPKSKYSSVNVDPSLLEDLNKVLGANDNNKLYEFLSNESKKQQLVTVWSYYNTVNDHPHFTSVTITLIKVIRLSNKEELQQLVIPLINDILNNHTKVLFRGLSNMKPSITNPILNLMTEIVRFKNGATIEDLLAAFDFNLATIPKLLSPSTFRSNFIEFWLALLPNTPYLQRQDLLTNYKKLNNSFYKFLSEDPPQLSKKIIFTLDSAVLSEPHYNKQTKCKIFNEYNLSNLVSLFNQTSDSSLKDQLHEFLIKLTTNEKFGLNFHDDRIWFRNTNGVAVPHSTFKIYNKLILSLVENLKPFEDDSHIKLVMEIFLKIPELIPPYTQYLFQIHGSNDPRLSSFWIGETLLLQQIIKLPIPAKLDELLVNNEHELSMDLIVENLLPAPLTKSCLVKSFQSESLFIRQITSHTMLFFFAKLKSLQKFLSTHQRDDLMSTLANYLIKTRLPELSVIVSTLSDTFIKNPDKKLLILTLTMTVKEYLLNFPYLTATLPNDVYLKLMKSELSGIELVTLDNYLELQENITDNNSITSKWWNAPNGQNSFFTNLLKLSISNLALSTKVLKILNKLVDQTIIFSKSVLISQIYLILQSLRFELQNDERFKIWNFFDEVISRSVRSPYKYLDRARELSDNQLSPIIIAMFEQWKFVKKTDNLNDWFCLLMRYMILSGESKIAIENLFNSNNIPLNIFLNFKNYESGFILSKDAEKDFFWKFKEESYFDYVLITPLQSIVDKKIPITEADLVGLIRRLELIILDTTVTLEMAQNAVILLLEKLGNYLSVSSIEFKEKYWKGIFISESNDKNPKLIFISRILNDIFKQLDFKSDAFNNVIYSYLKLNELDVVVSECCWCLSDFQLISFIESDSELIRLGVLRESLDRKLKIPGCNWTSSSSAELSLINELVQNGLVNANENVLLQLIKLNNINSYPLIESLCQKITIDINLIKHNELLIIVGGSVKPEENKDFLLKLVDDTIENFYANFSLQYIKLLLNTSQFLSSEKLEEISSKILSLEVVSKHAEYLFSIELMSFLLKLDEYGNSDFVSLHLIPWLLKSSLYINQTFAQSSKISKKFKEFLEVLPQFFPKINLWKFGSSILNTQLEILLNSKFVTDIQVLKYIYVIVQNSNFKIDYNKSLQIFLSNANNLLYDRINLVERFHSALIIHDLFYKNVTSNSNQTLQFNLLQFYQGTKRTDDLIIKKILIDIEALISFNLVNHFTSWEFTETYEEQFIKKEKKGLVITVAKSVVNRSINNHESKDLTLPQDLIKFYEANKLNEKVVTYDDEFLILLIINNDELFTMNENNDYKVDLKKLIDSNLLQFIIINMTNANKAITRTAIKILSGIFEKLEDGKTKDLYKVYLGNLLSIEESSSLVVSFYASLIPVLNNPNHTLYDKLTKYMVSSSRLKNNEIPLFKYISEPETKDLESYYRQVSWFLENLLHSLNDAEDLRILNKNNVMEWILNLNNSKYLNVGLKNLILSIILRITKIGGLSWLIKSYSLLSWLESLSLEPISSTNELINKQFKLNYEKLSMTVKLLVDNDEDETTKRKLNEWMDHDLDNHVKRICHH